jgi:hypothetical protein
MPTILNEGDKMLTPKPNTEMRADSPRRTEQARHSEVEDRHDEDEHHEHHHRSPDRIDFLRRASWGAILGGTAVAVVVQIMFTLLGISFGMGTVDPQTESNPMSGVGMAVGIWTAVGALVALFTGGWIAGRLAGTAQRAESTLHGVVTWAVVTLIAVWSMTSVVGSVLSTTTSALGNALQAAGQGVSAVMPNNVNAPNVSTQQVQGTAEDFLRQAGISQETVDQYISNSTQQLQNAATQAAQNPQQAYQEITTALSNIGQRGSDIAQRNISTQDAANLIARNTGIPQDRANAIAQQWSQRIQQANPEQEAQQISNQVQNTVARVGDKVAGGISSAAAWTFVSLLIGLIAAAIGGALGAVKRGLPA